MCLEVRGEGEWIVSEWFVFRLLYRVEASVVRIVGVVGEDGRVFEWVYF